MTLGEAYRQKIEEDLRRAILDLLAVDPGRAAGEELLRSALEATGRCVSLERQREAVDWLLSRGLVRPAPPEALRAVRITTRGLDVAQGRETHRGVAARLPGDAD